MARRIPPPVLTVGLATLAGLAAWLSMGALAVVDPVTRARVGVLPPWWLLLPCIGIFVGAALARRVPPSRLCPLALTVLVCLPWLPGRLPAAFLIWHGPVSMLVWGLVAVGLAAPLLARTATAVGGLSPLRAPRLVIALALAGFTAGAWSLQGRMPSGDEPHYLVITQSLWLDGDLRIENNHTRGDYTDYFRAELPPDYLRRGLDGQIYSIHAPGVSALVLPAFVLGGYPLAVLFLIVLAALSARLLWHVAWQLTGSVSAAWVATVGVWGSTPMFFQAFAVFPDAAGAGATTVGLWALASMARGERLSTRAIVAVGAALAWLPWLHTRFAVIAGILGGALALRLVATTGWRAVAALLAVPGVAAVAWFGYFWAIWGTLSPAAPYGGLTQSSAGHWLEGIPGLLFDQQFGLITTAPVFLLALAGVGALGRRHPRLAIEIGVLFIVYTLAVAAYRMWWGGYSSPARFLVAVLPAAGVVMAMAWEDLRAGGRAVAAVLLAISLAGVGVRASVADGALLYNLRDGVDLSLDWANHLVSLPLALPSLHRDAPLDAIRDALAWLLAGAVFTFGAGRLAPRAGQAWTLAVCAVALTAMVASTVAWRRHGMASLTPSASAIDLLRRWPTLPIGIGWQSRPYRVVDPAAVPPQLAVSGGNERGEEEEGRVVVFRSPRVPAGHYEVLVAGSPRLGGALDVRVGRTSQIVDRLPLADGGVNAPPMLHLPVEVHSLTIVTDADTAALVDRVTLRPLRVGSDGAPPDGYALRANRYGPVRGFLMDGRAYLEPGGVWTRGDETTALVIDTRTATGDAPAGPFGVQLRAGAAAVTVSISRGDWQITQDLAPGATEMVILPDAPVGVWPLRIRTSGGFRPRDHEPGSRDSRFLGVWMTFVTGDDAAVP